MEPEDLTSIFRQLRMSHGSHAAAARAIGVSTRHYYAWKNGECPIPGPMLKLLSIAARNPAMLHGEPHHAEHSILAVAGNDKGDTRLEGERP